MADVKVVSVKYITPLMADLALGDNWYARHREMLTSYGLEIIIGGVKYINVPLLWYYITQKQYDAIIKHVQDNLLNYRNNKSVITG